MFPSGTMTPITVPNLAIPVVVALVAIALASLIREPARQKFSAIMMAGAGATYFNGGFGPAEMVFCVVVTALAFRGLVDYRALGVGWLLHSGWDLAHDLWGNPIIPFAPSSSFGCFICDPLIAIWYFMGAPSIWPAIRRGDALARAIA